MSNILFNPSTSEGTRKMTLLCPKRRENITHISYLESRAYKWGKTGQYPPGSNQWNVQNTACISMIRIHLHSCQDSSIYRVANSSKIARRHLVIFCAHFGLSKFFFFFSVFQNSWHWPEEGTGCRHSQAVSTFCLWTLRLSAHLIPLSVHKCNFTSTEPCFSRSPSPHLQTLLHTS